MLNNEHTLPATAERQETLRELIQAARKLLISMAQGAPPVYRHAVAQLITTDASLRITVELNSRCGVVVETTLPTGEQVELFRVEADLSAETRH